MGGTVYFEADYYFDQYDRFSSFDSDHDENVRCEFALWVGRRKFVIASGINGREAKSCVRGGAGWGVEVAKVPVPLRKDSVSDWDCSTISQIRIGKVETGSVDRGPRIGVRPWCHTVAIDIAEVVILSFADICWRTSRANGRLYALGDIRNAAMVVDHVVVSIVVSVVSLSNGRRCQAIASEVITSEEVGLQEC